MVVFVWIISITFIVAFFLMLVIKILMGFARTGQNGNQLDVNFKGVLPIGILAFLSMPFAICFSSEFEAPVFERLVAAVYIGCLLLIPAAILFLVIWVIYQIVSLKRQVKELSNKISKWNIEP